MTAPALKQTIEHVMEICDLRRKGLWFSVDAVEQLGHPMDRIRVWGTLHFLPRNAPYCCGEPGCHLGLVGDRCAELNDEVQRRLGLANAVIVEFANRIIARYHTGITIRDESK